MLSPDLNLYQHFIDKYSIYTQINYSLNELKDYIRIIHELYYKRDNNSIE
jgi:hypothetical protein